MIAISWTDKFNLCIFKPISTIKMKPCKRCVLTVARSNRAFAAFSAGDRSGFKVHECAFGHQRFSSSRYAGSCTYSTNSSLNRYCRRRPPPCVMMVRWCYRNFVKIIFLLPTVWISRFFWFRWSKRRCVCSGCKNLHFTLQHWLVYSVHIALSAIVTCIKTLNCMLWHHQ